MPYIRFQLRPFPVKEPMPEFHSVEANLRAAMRFFGEATGSGEIQHIDGAVGIYSGLNYGVFNIALLERNGTARWIPAPSISPRARRVGRSGCARICSTATSAAARATLSKAGACA
jgi:hypothetical protein